MELVTFAKERHYVKAQQQATKRKSKRKGFLPCEIEKIVRYFNDCLGAVLCHGARDGAEGRLFGELSYKAVVVSTDLFPTDESVLRWNFSRPKDEWLSHFDVVYSNSLDHARWPWETLKVWFAQLHPSGRLCIQWNALHKNAKDGDCFGASLDEYITLINEVGEVVDLLYCANLVVVIVARKKDDGKTATS